MRDFTHKLHLQADSLHLMRDEWTGPVISKQGQAGMSKRSIFGGHCYHETIAVTNDKEL